MKKFTLELNSNWKYVHPIVRLTYWIEHDIRKGVVLAKHFIKLLLRELKAMIDPWQSFFTSDFK